jgi:glutamate-5-semialdehyde dehydrogenase
VTPDELARAAKRAAQGLAHEPTEKKNRVLSTLERLLLERKTSLFAENEKDLRNAEKEQMPSPLVDRLRIDEKVVDEMVASLQDVIRLADPVGEIVKLWKRPNGLLVGRMRIPIGVICSIYESRPNVTVDAFSLCFKSGNGAILKGGKEASHSNKALFGLIREALVQEGMGVDAVQLVDTSDRAYLYELLKMTDAIDLVIPRGGEALIRSVVEDRKSVV